MRICVIGKYPPIEGGVSAHTYWLARGLAARGHEVHVVTNANEVEDAYRMTFEPGDAEWFQPSFAHGGEVWVHEPAPFSHRAMSHIPATNPFVTKLASLATDVVRRHDCELILAYYFEPYAIAGWLASQWTDRPLIVKHAGSDLDRLLNVPDLATAYTEVLRTANAVVTQPALMPRFEGLGVDPARLVVDLAYSVPRSVFNSSATPLELAGDGQMPVVGVYGKIGISKGTFDLIAAVSALATTGTPVRLAMLIGEEQGRRVLPRLRDAKLDEQTTVLPLAPNWRVPAFLRACTAVCFLERDFPVAVHGPIIPREILASGACLILSGEIAAKQRYRDQLVDRDTFVLVQDPRDHDELAEAVRFVATDPSRAAAIGERGEQVSRTLEDHDAFVERWEELLDRVRRARSKLGHVSQSTVGTDPESVMPDLLAYLRRAWPAAVDGRGADDAANNPFDAGVDLCGRAEARLRAIAEQAPDPAIGGEAAMAADVVRYARVRLAMSQAPAESVATFAVDDRLLGEPVTLATTGALRPVRGASVTVLALDNDVSACPLLATVGGGVPALEGQADLVGIDPKPVLVLFHRAAGLVRCELRIDAPTRALMELCDGSRTTTEVVEQMCGLFEARGQEARTEVTSKVLAALDQLYRAGTLVFGELGDRWGWSGGVRLTQHGGAVVAEPRVVTS